MGVELLIVSLSGISVVVIILDGVDGVKCTTGETPEGNKKGRCV